MTRVLLAALAATVVIAGCGGDEATSTEGPAQAVPAQGTLAYVEAVVKPDDERAAGVKAALFKVSGRNDLLDLLVGELDKALADETNLSYERDVEPWLGERVGVFFLDFDDEPDGALVLEVQDEDKAQEALEKARAGFDEETVGELVEGRMLIGTRTGVDAAKRAAAGESLAESDAYNGALEPLDDERLGHAWIDVRRLFDSFGEIPGTEIYRDALRDAKNATAAIGLDISEDRFAIEVASDRELAEALGGFGAGRDTAASELLDELPADAWLAFGVSGAGRVFGEGFKQGLQAGAPGIDIFGELERRTGVDLDEDLFAQIEDLAFYASGTSLTSLGAGIVLGAKDGARVVDSGRRLVERLLAEEVSVEPAADGFVGRVRGAPVSFQVKRDDERVAIGLGGSGADELLAPDERLADSDTYEAAAGDLSEGARLAGFIDIAPLVELISGFAGDDPDWAEARRYVEAFQRLSIGDRGDGDVVVSEIVARLR